MKPPRLPLGDPCRGLCRAGDFEPASDELRKFCNVGYARGQCRHFSAIPSDAPDAIRFSITSDGGSTLALVYILEKNYSPASHGPLTYDIAARTFAPLNVPAAGTLLAQARMFVESYLSRRVRV